MPLRTGTSMTAASCSCLSIKTTRKRVNVSWGRPMTCYKGSPMLSSKLGHHSRQRPDATQERQCPPSSPNAADAGSSMRESVNDRASSPNDVKIGLLNDFSEIASRTVQHLKPQPPSGNVVSSTPAITTQNEEPARPMTRPARRRNEVGWPMFSLVYDNRRSMKNQRPTRNATCVDLTASRHSASNRQCIKSVVGDYDIT
ncbi:hypothetical protein EV122DRAFT_277573 [Schizophyllum commune]